jgi:spoIIIJ-associated protein
MSLIIEKEGKTVEQALEKGLQELGVRREDVEVEIVSLGSSGFLGIFGAKPAKIRIKMMARPKVKEIVESILEKMGMPGEIRGFREEGNLLIASLDCPTGEKYLKANRGAAIEAMDYLINKIFRESEYDIRLDIGGFLETQNDDLKTRALELAEKVKASGKEYEMEPMPPHRRKIVHQTLEKHGEVKTFAVGNGDRRRVIIAPKHAESKGHQTGHHQPQPPAKPAREGKRPEPQRGPKREQPREAPKGQGGPRDRKPQERRPEQSPRTQSAPARPQPETTPERRFQERSRRPAPPARPQAQRGQEGRTEAPKTEASQPPAPFAPRGKKKSR